MRSHLRRIFAFMILITLLAAAAGCGKAAPVEIEDTQEDTAEDVVIVVDEPDPEPKPEPEPEPEPEYTGPYNPLTGLPTEEDMTAKRPYAVMVNNIKVANPQEGVSKADIIFEAEVEGGITRMMAVFQDISGVDVVGSCRSSRHYYLDLAQGLDAIYIHAGGSPQAYSALRSRGIDNIDGVNGSGETFYRDSDRRSSMGYEHSLMLDPSLLPAYIEKHKIRTEHDEGYECNLQFADDDELILEGAETANKIVAHFSASKPTAFEYNAHDGVYYVNQYGGAYRDGHYDVQISAKNVITVFANVYNISGDDKGRLETILVGNGSGYLAVNGEYAPITWEKASASDRFVFKFNDGTPVVLGRGVSYICIVDKDNSVEFE